MPEFDVCKKVIDGACSLLPKKLCGWVKEVACFATELDYFCTPAQKKAAKTKRLADNGPRKMDIPHGSGRTLGFDEFGRASQARATVSTTTLNERRAPNTDGTPASSIKPRGWKPKCKLDKGHLVGRQFGGPGDDPQNFVPLPHTFNTVTMRTKENWLKAQITDRGIREFKYIVTPKYERGGYIPSDIYIRVVSTKGPHWDHTVHLEVPQYDPPKGC